jgi:hypothetical protein
MSAIAASIFLIMLAVSIWAWRLAPARLAADQFINIWRAHPWGKQLLLDFFGLELMLALWMLTDAVTRGTWILATACTLLMPIFGAMPAAVYWRLRGP